MLTGLLAMIIVVIKAFPETPIARIFYHWTVAELVRLMAKIERHHIIFALIVLVVIQGLAMAASIVTADLAMVMAWDVALYVDTVIAIWTVAAVTRVRAGFAPLRFWLGRILTGARRSPRMRRTLTKKPRQPSNDDEHPGRITLAA